MSSLDPRTKLLLTALFSTLVFVVDALVVAAGQLFFFIALCLVGGIPAKKLFPRYKLLLFLAAFVMVLQYFFGGGLETGLMISCRIASLAVLMPALTMTTGPRLLAQGITRLGVNYRAAHIITSTFNLIPSFEEEAKAILDARKLRGLKSIKLKEYPAIVLPLMIKAMRQAQLIGLAMDTRAFGAHKTRTWLEELRFSARDYVVLAAGILYSAFAVTANYVL